MKKKRKVVMLPTKNKALRVGQILTYTDDKDTRFLPRATKAGATTWSGQNGYQAHEIYVISDEIPKVGERYLLGNEILIRIAGFKDTEYINCNKIIGSSDHDLTDLYDNWKEGKTLEGNKMVKRSMRFPKNNRTPTLSEKFLDAFVSKDGIYEVMVEYEDIMVDYADSLQWEGHRPKVKDNKLIITEAKVSYTEDEMFMNMQYYMEYCEREGYVTPHEWVEKHKHFD